MRMQRSRHKWGPVPRSTSYWGDIVRPEWIVSMKRHGLHEQTRRLALNFLDRHKPGNPHSRMSVEEAWLRISTADGYIRKGIANGVRA